MTLPCPPVKGGVSRRRTGGSIFFVIALFLAFLAAATEIPPLKARVTDLTGTLSAEPPIWAAPQATTMWMAK